MLKELDMYQEIAVAKGVEYDRLNKRMDKVQDNIEKLSDDIQRLQGTAGIKQLFFLYFNYFNLILTYNFAIESRTCSLPSRRRAEG